MDYPNFFDPDFTRKIGIYNKQVAAAQVNARALEDFNNAVDNWVTRNITNRDNHLSIDAAPTAPLKWVVNDDGSEQHVPFPAEVLHVATLPVPTNVVPSASSFFGGATTGQAPVPADRTDRIIGMLIGLNLDIQKIKEALKV